MRLEMDIIDIFKNNGLVKGKIIANIILMLHQDKLEFNYTTALIIIQPLNDKEKRYLWECLSDQNLTHLYPDYCKKARVIVPLNERVL